MASMNIDEDFIPTEEQLKTFEEYLLPRALVPPPPVPNDLPPIVSEATVDPNLESSEGGDEFAEFDDAPAEFEGAEHSAISNNLKIYEFNGTQNPAKTKTLWTVNSRKGGPIGLTFGRIIALGGDHYSNTDKDRSPICGAFYNYPNTPEGQEYRFDCAVKSLLNDSDGYLAGVTELLDQEEGGVEKAEKLNLSIKQVYHEHSCGLPTDEKFWEVEKSFGATTLSFYSWLAWINADHFGDDAVTCYKAGHNLAMKKAREAASKGPASEKQKGLYEAYVYDAFAAHFLTDLFSAGHIRAPRRNLHCNSSTLMSATALQGKILPGRNGETPVWDHHSRYMHDDDNATGLIVRNKRGDQWIVYGDKQLKEPSNRINLARAGHCLQASVDEIFKVGFQGTGPINPDTFAALSLIPEPMVSIQGKPWLSSWGNYDMHNPAPLWVAKKDDGAETKDWTSRKVINDHSNYSRVDGSPAASGMFLPLYPKASQLAWDIRDASFRGDDQYVASVDLGALTSGGFLQIQDLEKGKGCINIWGPSTVETDSKQDTFTLRSRLIDVVKPSEVETGKTLYWTKWYNEDAQTTSLFRFDWTSNGSTADVVASGYNLKNLGLQFQNFDPSIEVTSKYRPGSDTAFYRESLLSGLPAEYGRANLTRFLAGKFTPDSGPANPDLFVVTFANDGKARAAIRSVQDDGKLGPAQTLEWQAKPGVRTWVKKFVGENQKDSVGVISMISKSGAKFNFKVTRIWSEGDSILKQSDFEIGFYWKGLAEDVSVLVGSTSGSGHPEIVIIGDDGVEDTTLQTYAYSDDMTGLSAKGKHICDDTRGDSIERQYFHSLIPSVTSKSQSTTGLDVLTVQLQKKNNKRYIVFNVHQRSKSSTDAKPWTSCDPSSYEDPLASSPNFFHIKWIRCEWQYTTNAVMQIFSWYGVLGVRVFTPEQGTNKDWTLIGILPYLGQTSIGAGLGVTGDWGNGLMSWGENQDFVDINECVSRQGYRSWAMSEKDTGTPNIRGYEVEKRLP
ncbi:hypothetical protein ABW19_dt0207749 [Dactylella cylindrospora]|nr:hypothetical protein ABW19_dt0207749 [Dactylella cylindrospora]